MDFTFTRAMMKLKKANPIKISPIGVRNQRKFAPNPSPIGIGFQPAHQLVFLT